MKNFKPIAVLGAGAFGTALALHLANRGQSVRIWSIESSEIDAMLNESTNNRFLPGFNFPKTLKPTADLSTAIENVEEVLIAVPSVGFRNTLNLLKPLLKKNQRIVIATKGIDAKTGQPLNEVVEEELGRRPYAVLSGPSFAREVAAGLPTAVVIASRNKDLRTQLAKRFTTPEFQVVTSSDVIGLEIGGVVKNVMAIATGIVDGMSLGANARSAIITYGLNEMIRLGRALGGKIETFVGLSGVGDLILTCMDDLSRNRRFGLALGKGLDVIEAERQIGQAIEGKRNAILLVKLAKTYDVDMPICTTVLKILQGKLSTQKGIAKMLQNGAAR